MSKVERIEQEVQGLSPEELAEFRHWFLEFVWEAWDRQLERDVRVGKLDSLADLVRSGFESMRSFFGRTFKRSKMRVKYFADTDTALVGFTDNEVADTREITEDIDVDLDRHGNLVSMHP